MERAIAEQLDQLFPMIQDILFGTEDDMDIEEVVAKLFTKKGYTLATAESFTGGKIAQTVTSVPGASAYFKGSVVCYATAIKTKVLQVPQSLVDAHSVVSAPVAEAMAQGVQKMMDADFAIATTGNAGPTKGDSPAEVGTVFIALATPNRVFAQEFQMGSHRERIVQKSVNKAFEMLQKEILKM
jgi:nicotinamide-nucleotide amidase